MTTRGGSSDQSFIGAKLLAVNWYGIMLLCAIVRATIEALMGKTHPKWTGLGIVWLVIAAIVAWFFYRAKKSGAREFAALSARRPDWISLETSRV